MRDADVRDKVAPARTREPLLLDERHRRLGRATPAKTGAIDNKNSYLRVRV